MTSPRMWVMALVLAAAGGAGWLSAGRADALRSATPQAGTAGGPSLPDTLLDTSPVTPEELAEVTASGRRVTPETPLTPRDLEYLKHDASEWAKQMSESGHADRMASCKDKLPDAPDSTCEQIFQAFTGVTAKYLALQQRFLSGDIDQVEYQTTFHRIMLEQTVALELAMTPRQYLTYLGIPQGEDVYIDLSGGLVRMASADLQLGSDVLDRRSEP